MSAHNSGEIAPDSAAFGYGHMPKPEEGIRPPIKGTIDYDGRVYGPGRDWFKPTKADIGFTEEESQLQAAYQRGFKEGCDRINAKERRERIATAILAGFAHTDRALNYFTHNARYAILSADALIAELDKEGR